MATQPRKRSKKPTHRLEELDVREVSLVDRPANQKPFLIVKCEGVPNELTEAEAMAKRAAVAASEAKPTGVVIEIEGIEKLDPLAELVDDEEEPTPDPVSKDEVEDDPEVEIEDDDSETEGEDDEPQPVTKESAVKLTSESLTRLMDVVNAISKADALEDSHASELRDIAKALSPEASAAEVAKEEARKVTTNALAELMNTVSLVKSLDDSIDELPDTVTKKIDEIAASLIGVADVAIAKEEVTNPDQEEPQIVVYKSGRDDGDLDLVIKRGAKMKTTRLSKLKEAHAMLTKLIEELEGEKAASDGGGKKKKTTKSDETPTETEETEGVDVESIVAKVTDGVKSMLVDSIKKVNETLNGLKGEIDAVTKRVDDVDGTVPDGNADDEEEPEETKKADEGSFNNILGING